MTSLLKEDITPHVRYLPAWLKQDLPDREKCGVIKRILEKKDLHTVCQSARCPNLGTCWGQGVATFMILGDTCTRACRFCAVASGKPLAVDSHEPEKIARVVAQWRLRYVVVTSVTRDDLSDKGAGQFVSTVRAIKRHTPEAKVELLIPDFQGNAGALFDVVSSGCEVIGHNIETVRRLTPLIRPQASYQRSLDVLEHLGRMNPELFLKSGFMVGLGENDDEIRQAMNDLKKAGCHILTIGQYLRPRDSVRHWPVQRYVAPQDFERFQKWGLDLGFRHVFSAPLVRSSFLAERGYDACVRVAGDTFSPKEMG